MTKKRLTQVPKKSFSDVNIMYQDHFRDQIAQLDCTSLHFFDESGVKITLGNRVFGNSYIGEPAIEFQRYASNANYTLNLLHSIQGVDYCNILRGASKWNGNAGLEISEHLDAFFPSPDKLLHMICQTHTTSTKLYLVISNSSLW